MRKRFRIRNMLIVLSVCALGAVGLDAFIYREPSFKGRRLSDWIWQMNGKGPGPEKEEARTVVRQLASNSIPLLLRWLQQEDRPSLTGRFDTLRHGVYFWLVRHKVVKSGSIGSLPDFNPSHSAMATWALPELDPAGRKAVIPKLIEMLGDNNQPDVISEKAGASYMVLSKMAPESIAPLTEALSSKDIFVKALAACALGEIGPSAKAAIPFLQKGLSDNNPDVRVSSAAMIGKIGGDPGIFVPVVIQTLPEINWENMGYTLDLLVRYKEHAKAVVPLLTSILTNNPASDSTTNRIVRDHVINALLQIDPMAAAKAGVQQQKQSPGNELPGLIPISH
jgi:hypothetical protein